MDHSPDGYSPVSRPRSISGQSTCNLRWTK